MLPSLVVALSLAVPYLPQTDALCGGAAAAMVFRYWGDAHADVEQFAPLVDRRAKGIADDVLVRAVQARGWETLRFAGSVETLKAEIDRRHPIVVLVADRKTRYHYLVVTDVDDSHVVVHDPTWGPSRPIAIADFVRIWRPTNFWSLLILPLAAREIAPDRTSSAPTATETSPSSTGSGCDRLLEEAVDEARRVDARDAYPLLDRVRAQCPDSAGPLRELAGVQFAAGRWRAAADLAERAVAREPKDNYAWDILGSSRFVQDDLPGALVAWNQIGEPRIDLVHIDGLRHTRYKTIADSLRLKPNTLLTAGAFQLAARRLQELPDRSAARLSYRPAPDGYAEVEATVVERSGLPRGTAEWFAQGARVAVDREVRVDLPGPTSQGEMWSASWRWWSNRPRVAISFAAPHVGAMPGIWRVDGSWESQAYAFDRTEPIVAETVESHAHGGLSVSDWLAPGIRYVASAGFDAWRQAGANRRAAFVGASLERRWFDDRWSMTGKGTAWLPVSGGSTLRDAGVRTAFVSSASKKGSVYLADLGAERVSDAAPLELWPGATDGHASPLLVRAHPLLDDGIFSIANGSVFGRTVKYASAEAQRWFEPKTAIHLGVATFVDLASASRGPTPEHGGAVQLDLGIGLRIGIPGSERSLRVDLAHGTRDGADALTIGWQ
jgi:predicted double-glycine peptidase